MNQTEVITFVDLDDWYLLQLFLSTLFIVFQNLIVLFLEHGLYLLVLV